MEDMLLFWVAYIAILALVIVSYWVLFTKAGKPGWASIIPIYNIIVALEIVGKPWWWMLLLFIPIVNIFIGLWLVHLFSLSFGKNIAFTIGLILLPFVFYPILAFGDARYHGPGGVQDTFQSQPNDIM